MNKTYTFLLIGVLIAVLYGMQQYALPLAAPLLDEKPTKKDGFCGGCTKYQTVEHFKLALSRLKVYLLLYIEWNFLKMRL